MVHNSIYETKALPHGVMLYIQCMCHNVTVGVLMTMYCGYHTSQLILNKLLA